MRVRRIDTELRRDVHKFVTFPFELYRNCPQWVPPLISSAKGDLNRSSHPFYRHSDADFFIVESGGQALGRIAVMENRNFNAHAGKKAAFFGFFDLVDDVQVSRALFGAAFDWARARGLTEIAGPRGLIGSDASGVLVEGFEHRPALNVAYNYPYYRALIEDAGFQKDTDHLSGYFERTQELPERLFRIAERVKQRSGFWIKTFSSKDEMRQWVPHVFEVHRQSFGERHTFYPLTEEEAASVADTIIGLADPRLVKLVMKGEEVVGFVISYHDISAGLQKARGHLWPIGWYHILRDRRRTKWADGNGVGILPAYQGFGGNAVLYAELAKTLFDFGFEHVEVVEVDEKNFESRSDQEFLGVIWHKRHRHYKRTL